MLKTNKAKHSLASDSAITIEETEWLMGPCGIIAYIFYSNAKLAED